MILYNITCYLGIARQGTHGSTLNINIDLSKSCLKKNLKKCSHEIWQDRWNLSEAGRRTFLFLPQFNSNRASFSSRTNQFITVHRPFVSYLLRFGLCSHDRCVCSAKGDPNHYAAVCPVTKPFHFTKPSAENISMWCENIVQDKRSLERLTNIMKILHERRHDIIMN
ncbi:hypothetical protein AVEN_180431-1 [Araneus ventricosus]|uniref:Reverse transcriptase zinc-binding domain-containing protein n=1 Tax=Araneus ventricosus TaxID=182803 RepID=A0A4Y2RM43_ARAVE|nr:hypothetical protein AVEN_180431-1 [Araneus ventricosus]